MRVPSRWGNDAVIGDAISKNTSVCQRPDRQASRPVSTCDALGSNKDFVKVEAGMKRARQRVTEILTWSSSRALSNSRVLSKGCRRWGELKLYCTILCGEEFSQFLIEKGFLAKLTFAVLTWQGEAVHPHAKFERQPRNLWNAAEEVSDLEGQGNSPNFKMGWYRGLLMPWAIKLDHLQPFAPFTFLNFSIFFTFILGGQFLLPQRSNNGKGNSSNPKSGWDRGFSVPGTFKLDHLHPF